MTTKVIEPSAGDILRHAASLMEEWGSCCGNYIDETGAMCESGALEAASGYATHEDNNGQWSIREFNLYKAWKNDLKAKWALSAVGGGANHSDRATHEERVAKLLEAAAWADEQESK